MGVLFQSKEDFERQMEEAGLTKEVCTYRAGVSLVSFAGGIENHDEASVRRALLTVGNNPLEVTIHESPDDQMRPIANAMCAACGMCVSFVGDVDFQHVMLPRNEGRECPVFSAGDEVVQQG